MTRPSPATRRPRVRRGNADDHDQARRTLLAAAFALYERSGLAALSMRTLAGEVGLSPMAIYRYYPNKAALLLAMWESVLADSLVQHRAAVARQSGARGRLRAATESFLRYWEARPEAFRLVFMTEETTQPDPEPALVRSSAYREAVDFSQQTIEAFIAEVGGRPELSLQARDLRLALTVGYLHARHVNQRFPWSDFDALRSNVLDAVMRGIEDCVTKPRVSAPRGAAR